MRTNEHGLAVVKASYQYTRRGWAIYPLAPASKRPLSGSHGHLDATTDRSKLERLFNGSTDLNIGIRTGAASGIVVIDVDNHQDGANGYDSIRELESQGLKLPMGGPLLGVGVVDTPSGGLHLFYAAPTGVEIRSTASVLAPGLDTRGEGGYVAAAPSRTEAGAYKWRRLPTELLPLPSWIVERLKVARIPVRRSTDAAKDRATATPSLAVDHALRERLGNVANAGKGYRNEVLNSEAWYLSRFIGKGFDAAQLTEWLVRAALRNGMGEREALRTINSALTDSATK